MTGDGGRTEQNKVLHRHGGLTVRSRRHGSGIIRVCLLVLFSGASHQPGGGHANSAPASSVSLFASPSSLLPLAPWVPHILSLYQTRCVFV